MIAALYTITVTAYHCRPGATNRAFDASSGHPHMTEGTAAGVVANECRARRRLLCGTVASLKGRAHSGGR